VRGSVIYIVSIALHLGLAVGLVALREPRRTEAKAITMVDVKKAPAKETPPPPPPTPTDPTPARRKVAARPAAAPPPTAAPPPAATAGPSEAPPAAGPAVPDFGLVLSGGGGPGGLAVPGPRPAAVRPTPAPARPKVLEAAPPPKAELACADPPVKPRPIDVVQPAYTEEARTAQIEGKVRVEITVDASGAVINARVLAGLGYGLDEAALAAAKASRFEPGSRCGAPVESTFVIGMRFSL
jgi:protein TonB